MGKATSRYIFCGDFIIEKSIKDLDVQFLAPPRSYASLVAILKLSHCFAVGKKCQINKQVNNYHRLSLTLIQNILKLPLFSSKISVAVGQVTP